MRQQSVQRHLVKCPHCGRDVLDHMSVCPVCEGALKPLMREARSDEQLRKTKNTLRAIGFTIAAFLVLWRLLAK
jgi:hypothetical protein